MFASTRRTKFFFTTSLPIFSQTSSNARLTTTCWNQKLPTSSNTRMWPFPRICLWIVAQVVVVVCFQHFAFPLALMMWPQWVAMWQADGVCQVLLRQGIRILVWCFYGFLGVPWKVFFHWRKINGRSQFHQVIIGNKGVQINYIYQRKLVFFKLPLNDIFLIEGAADILRDVCWPQMLQSLAAILGTNLVRPSQNSLQFRIPTGTWHHFSQSTH